VRRGIASVHVLLELGYILPRVSELKRRELDVFNAVLLILAVFNRVCRGHVWRYDSPRSCIAVAVKTQTHAGMSYSG